MTASNRAGGSPEVTDAEARDAAVRSALMGRGWQLHQARDVLEAIHLLERLGWQLTEPEHAHVFGPWKEADQSNNVRECECGARQWD